MKITQLVLIVALVIVAGFILLMAHPLDAQAGVCSGNNCRYMYCTSNADCGPTQFTGTPSCQGNDIWQMFTSYSCINPGTSGSYCVTSSIPRYEATCAGGQVCQSGKCVSPYNPGYGGGTCFNHTSKRCIGNLLYWYNSCGAHQDVAQDCTSSGLVCSQGACIKPATTGTGTGTSTGTGGTGTGSGTGNAHYMTKCQNGNIVWFDAAGNPNDVFRSCDDNNSCTIDSCDNSQCSNELKCDGSSCPTSSADYQKYCNGQTAGVSAATAGEKLRDFVKKWYGWIILIVILLILFVVIFRRLSTRV